MSTTRTRPTVGVGAPFGMPSTARICRAVAILMIAAAIGAACTSDRPAPAIATATPSARSTPTATPIAVPSIPGVSAECAAAAVAWVAGDPVGRSRLFWECDSFDELAAADRVLDVLQNAYQADLASFVADGCLLYGFENSPVCLDPRRPRPTATATPVEVFDDPAFQDRALELCDRERPARLYSVTGKVKPFAAVGERDGVWFVFVEFKDLRGRIQPEPNLEQGYVYDINDQRPSFGVTFTTDVDLIACLALRATEREMWYPSTQSGCPCSPYDASDAILWMVDPVTRERIGSPWLRHPPVTPTDRGRLFGGAGDDPGVRPPAQEDIITDIETFLGG